MYPRRRGPLHCRRHGYTLVELAITLAIGSVLLTAGVPSLMTMVYNERVATRIDLLLADVDLARLEAIKRNQDVVLCRSHDGRQCDHSSGARADWSEGRIVYVNPDGDEAREAGEPLLQVRPGLPRGMTLSFNQWWRVIFHGDGSARSGAFTLCDFRGSKQARALILYYTGRPRVSAERADGDPLNCRPLASGHSRA